FDEHRTPTRCSRAPSTGCRCRDADGRASRAPPAPSPRSPAWTTSVRITSRWREHLRRFDVAGYERRLAERGYRFVSDLPPLLRAIHDPPPGLFVRGLAPAEMLSRPAVAIVGARACSGYGASVARSLGRELAAAGLVVVSGLARGVDGEAHRGALDAGGSTVAVLGCGIDRDYPAAHADLARRIAETGLIVSEYAPGVEPA